jgi:hypothetical protein
MLLELLYFESENKQKFELISGQNLAEKTGLNPFKINQAANLLKSRGYVEWLTAFGRAPFDFVRIALTSRGAYEAQRRQEAKKTIGDCS